MISLEAYVAGLEAFINEVLPRRADLPDAGDPPRLC